jgi:hypothetical protein
VSSLVDPERVGGPDRDARRFDRIALIDDERHVVRGVGVRFRVVVPDGATP